MAVMVCPVDSSNTSVLSWRDCEQDEKDINVDEYDDYQIK